MAQMPPVVAKVGEQIGKVPWAKLAGAVTWLFTVGRGKLEENTTQKERDRLWTLFSKSKGLPTNLTTKERTDLRKLVQKALTGKKPT